MSGAPETADDARRPARSKLTLGDLCTFVALLIALPGSMSAEGPVTVEPGWVHQQWTVEDGLPVNVLGSVLQAEDGYIWIASYDGLVRFDGAEFEVFTTSEVPSLESNRIIALEQTGDVLWILSEAGGLVRHRGGVFEPVDLPVVDRHPAPTPFLRDLDGRLWFSNSNRIFRVEPSGLSALDLELDTGIRISHFAFDGDGTLWLVTGQGITSFTNGTASREYTGGDVESMLPEDDRVLFFRKDAPPLEHRDGNWRELREEVAPGVDLSGPAVVRLQPWGDHFVLSEDRLLTFAEGAVRVLETADAAHLGQRAGVFDPAGRRWWGFGRRVIREEELVFELPEDTRIESLAFDVEGTLWLTTVRGGLHALRPASVAVVGERDGLPTDNIYALYEDRSRQVWIGTHGQGLWRLAEGELVGFHRRGDRSRTSFPRSVVEDPSGRLWVGLLGGLYRLDGDELVPASELGELEITDRVNALLIDGQDRLWVGTTGGLYRRDPVPGGHEWTSIHSEVLARANVRALAEGSNGAIWVGTARGVARVDDETIELLDRRSGLPSDLVRALLVDSVGVLWIGTEDRGLVRLDPASLDRAPDPDLTVFDTAVGLYSNGVHAILEDGLGSLWMNSNQGVFQVRRSELEAMARGELTSIESVGYSERDGLRNREGNGGSNNAGLASHDGRLWFAGQGGAVVVDPGLLREDVTATPPLRIERLRAGGSTRPFPRSGIDLSAEERSFSIEYTAITLRSARRLRFRYRLEGFDPEWVDVGPRREAFFTRVPAGRYDFVVESRVAGQDWSGVTVSHPLRVAPRITETWWFRGLAALAVLAAFLVLLRLQARHERAQRRRLEEIVAERTAVVARQAEQLRQLDRAKSDLFTNVSHEFRTPLTLTIGPLQDLLDGTHGPLPAGAREDIALALRNSHKVLGLINQILDVAKLEAGGVTLQVEALDLVPWLRRRLDAFHALGERNSVRAVFEPPEESLTVFADARQLAKVIDNLLANAFNLTPDGGTVRLIVEPRGPLDSGEPRTATGSGSIAISVVDTGPGIPEDDLPRIFDRFQQVEAAAGHNGGNPPPRRWAGTGIGLALAKEIVQLHHGTLSAESVEGEGATFTVVLREGRDHFPGGQLIESARAADSPDAMDPEEFPAETDDSRPASTHSSAGEPGSGAGSGSDAVELVDGDGAQDRATVLVVDDQPEVRRYIGRQLRPEFRVVEAADGAEALHLARQRVPDLVVSDVMMPNLDGYGLARALKGDPELDFVPIILLTAKASTSNKIEGLQEGVDDYLTKPFEARELVARARNLIDGRRRLEQRLGPTEGFVLRLPPADFQPSDQSFLERVRDIIATRLGDPDFGVESLAEALGCDRTYLFRKLRELLDETPSGLLRDLRLARAREMLGVDAGSVSEVAYAVGFKSVSHFSQRFRALYGTTPSKYAAEQRSKPAGQAPSSR